MLRHAALRLRPVGARPRVLLPCPGASAARSGGSGARQGSLRRIATARPRPLTLPQSRAPKLLPLACRAARPLSSTPPPLEEEEKAPASASERIQHFVSNLTVADAARYGTYAAGGFGVYMVSKGVLGTINTLLHLPPTTVAKYGFYSGFLVASATAVAMRQAWLAIHIRPEFVYREALAMIRRSQAVIDHLGTPYPSAVPLRTYNLDGGNFFPGGALGVQWKPPRVVMMFAVEGAKEEGIVYLECLKNLNGRLHFTFVGVDVCDVDETRLIVHGSDERMTEKADHLQKLIDFKKDNSPPKE